MQLSERLSILKTIMLRRDLSAAAQTLAWFLLMERTNAETSLCYSKNKNLAADLGVDITTIERAKRQLIQAGVLFCDPQPCGSTRASFYRFKKTGSLRPAELRVSDPQHCGSPATLRANQTRNPAGQQNNDPATDRRIEAGLAQLAGKLKAGDIVAVSSSSSTAQKQWSKSAWRRHQ